MIKKRFQVFGSGEQMFEKANLIRLRGEKEKANILLGKTDIKEGLREYRLANAETKINMAKHLMENVRLKGD